jgi:hypothetical protein
VGPASAGKRPVWPPSVLQCALIVPTLRVGRNPLTLCVTWRRDNAAATAERGAFRAAFPRRAWKRSAKQIKSFPAKAGPTMPSPSPAHRNRNRRCRCRCRRFCRCFSYTKRPTTAKRDLGAGRTQVLRSGPSRMDAARAPSGHGCPFGAGPRSKTGVRVFRRRRNPTRSRHPWLLGVLFQVTRRRRNNLPLGRCP